MQLKNIVKDFTRMLNGREIKIKGCNIKTTAFYKSGEHSQLFNAGAKVIVG